MRLPFKKQMLDLLKSAQIESNVAPSLPYFWLHPPGALPLELVGKSPTKTINLWGESWQLGVVKPASNTWDERIPGKKNMGIPSEFTGIPDFHQPNWDWTNFSKTEIDFQQTKRCPFNAFPNADVASVRGLWIWPKLGHRSSKHGVPSWDICRILLAKFWNSPAFSSTKFWMCLNQMGGAPVS